MKLNVKRVMKARWIFVLIFTVTVFFSNAQNSQGVFEYVSAKFDAVGKVTVLDFKNAEGDIRQFQCYGEDKLKTEGILYNKPDGSNKSSLYTVTKNELIGKKFNISYTPIGEIDPASPYCCYKISEFTPL